MLIGSNAQNISPLQVGEVIPNSKLISLDNKEENLHNIIGEKASVLIFYRGGW